MSPRRPTPAAAPSSVAEPGVERGIYRITLDASLVQRLVGKLAYTAHASDGSQVGPLMIPQQGDDELSERDAVCTLADLLNERDPKLANAKPPVAARPTYLRLVRGGLA